jgi:replication-associated recombination protein RarA
MSTTKRGYDFNELLSALQKDIRRGKEYEALFWAIELEGFNPTALWNRLKVIASEDIGCASPFVPMLIETLAKQYSDFKGKAESRLFLANAVVILARSKKSRITDDLLNVVYGEILHEDKKLKIPDYALDMHTLRGRKLGRGIEHFFAVGNTLENETFPNPYTQKAKEILMKYGKLPKSESEKV